jgi:hypothetical protein
VHALTLSPWCAVTSGHWTPPVLFAWGGVTPFH